MIELPEAVNFVKQLKENISGRRVQTAVAGSSPHKFAWYTGDPAAYRERLAGQTIGQAANSGGLVAIPVENDLTIVLGDGTRILLHQPGSPRPQKHQLLLEFTDDAALSVSIQGYGCVGCQNRQELAENTYYQNGQTKPSPFSDAFNEDYFLNLYVQDKADKLSVKAFLATQQRIPGFGNGVLQDTLFNARLHPRRKSTSLTDAELGGLYHSLKDTLAKMAALGGRDVEIDLFGNKGGYTTLMSKNTAGKPCPVCGDTIQKESYLGGSIYFCPNCQRQSAD